MRVKHIIYSYVCSKYKEAQCSWALVHTLIRYLIRSN